MSEKINRERRSLGRKATLGVAAMESRVGTGTLGAVLFHPCRSSVAALLEP